MFARRDIPSTALLSVLVFFVLMTVFQILMMHTGSLSSKVHEQRKLHMELRELDINLHSVMMQTVPSVELNRRLLQNQINSKRFLEILREASSPISNKNNHSVSASTGDIDTNSAFHQTQHKMADNENSFISITADRQLSDSLSASGAFKSAAAASEHLNPTTTTTAATQTPAHLHVDIDPHVAAGNDKASVGLLINQHLASISSQQNTISEMNTYVERTMFSRIETTSPNHKHTKLVGLPINDETRQKLDYRSNDTTVPIKSNETRSFVKQHVTDESKSGAQSNNSLQGGVSYCPAIPPNLQGNFKVNLSSAIKLSPQDLINAYPHIEAGGTWQPSACTARHKVLVVIPYRDRERHLIALLNYLHPLLQRQQLHYRVAVVEQMGNATFNKARIMNIAFVESLKRFKFQCAIFHDVDLVPEDDRNMYSCPRQPRHMSVGIDEMGYKLAYPELVGGVLNMRTEHFQRVNGYSNLYWGWGAEDDDMAYRIMQVGLQITRPPENVARYKMIQHTKRKPSDYRKRVKLLITGTRRYQFDGLNSLSYKLVHVEETPLYTHILVDIGKPPRGFR